MFDGSKSAIHGLRKESHGGWFTLGRPRATKTVVNDLWWRDRGEWLWTVWPAKQTSVHTRASVVLRLISTWCRTVLIFKGDVSATPHEEISESALWESNPLTYSDVEQLTTPAPSVHGAGHFFSETFPLKGLPNLSREVVCCSTVTSSCDCRRNPPSVWGGVIICWGKHV